MNTIGHWIELPTGGGASDRFRADQPGGSGVLQIAASNATLACRENGLRTLWEDPGSPDVYLDNRTTGYPSTFRWHEEDSAGAYVRLAGVFRVRLYGETRDPPRVHLACRALAPATYTTGIIVAAFPLLDSPVSAPGHYATATTTSTTIVDLAATLTLGPGLLGVRPTTHRSAGTVVESGAQTELAIWVGAWCTSGSSGSKAEICGLTLSLREP